ncbi:MAG: D-aminoacyl-tRNA deacylase [Flavobacteriales bacterium]
MRCLIQRVSNASVTIDNSVYSEINEGLLVLLGIEDLDSQEDIKWLVKKISQMRIFSDEDGKMNLSVIDKKSEILVVSQFTLYASTKKGNRPSFIKSAKPEIAIPLYESFIKSMNETIENEVKTGVFGADMKVDLTNDGPVTIWLDSKNKE